MCDSDSNVSEIRKSQTNQRQNQSRQVVQKIKSKFSKKVRNLARAAQEYLLPKKVVYQLLILWNRGPWKLLNDSNGPSDL